MPSSTRYAWPPCDGGICVLWWQIEEEAYPRPWTTTLFLSELAQRSSRRYMVATLGPLGGRFLRVHDRGGRGPHHHRDGEPGVAPARHRHAVVVGHGPAARALGIRHLTLEVRVGNDAAQSLYRRFGFAPVGVRRNYYAETGEDAIIMWARDIDDRRVRRRAWPASSPPCTPRARVP